MNATRVLLVGAVAVFLLRASPETWAADAKPKKPTLELRAVPRMGFSPLTVLFIAELKGGDDVEQYYCPEVEWEWSDGGKSVQESDCPPYEAGASKIGRRCTTEHLFRYSGNYRVVVRLLKTRKAFAKADVSVTVRPGRIPLPVLPSSRLAKPCGRPQCDQPSKRGNFILRSTVNR